MAHHMSRPRRRRLPVGRKLPLVRRSLPLMLLVTLLLLINLVLPDGSIVYAAPILPSGFQEEIVFSGLTRPTEIQFASDGRVFVAEKNGLIKVFDNLTDPTPTIFADLRTNVYNYHDRGLIGLALDPTFPAKPDVYVLYTHDAEIGGTAPKWGTPGATSDPCPDPPGGTVNGCIASGRLSRLQAAGNVMASAEEVLVEDWCQQYPSHSIGSLVFGADGALYVSGGDGANYGVTDYGQFGMPVNPCGDPPGGVGATLSPPTAEGGALRSQDLRTSGDPITFDGTILRLDPANPSNRRIIAYGLRNPARFTARPGTDELWIGDVGWNTWEELNRINSASDTVVENFAWPCFEGNLRQGNYDGTNLNICENLYNEPGAITAPFYAYNHSSTVVAGESCPTGGSSITGLAFYNGNTYPNSYNGALFFADYTRHCIWAIRQNGGTLDLANREVFVAGAATPVSLRVGPNGDLFYVDHVGGTIRRITYAQTNQQPVAIATASPTSGTAPLTVVFNGSGSSDPDSGDVITYAWDLDGDGAFDDSTLVNPTYTYNQSGNYTAVLKVTDRKSASATASVTISVNNTPPTPIIDTPAGGTRWQVGQTISFSGHATDQQDVSLPASALTWSIVILHGDCASSCHEHLVQTIPGVTSGSFTTPDHQHPSQLELRLTARDSGGLETTTTRRLEPLTVNLTFQSSPSGLQLSFNGVSKATPFSSLAIIGSSNDVSAPSPQILGGTSYKFVSWSDVGAQTHQIRAGSSPATFSATYATLPTAPSNLRATAASATQLNLTWSDNSNNESGFKIERCIASNCTNFQEVATVGANVTGIQNTGLGAKTTYRYRIRAYNSVGDSSYSNTADARTKPK